MVLSPTARYVKRLSFQSRGNVSSSPAIPLEIMSPVEGLWSRVAGFQVSPGLRARPPVEDWPDLSRRSHLGEGGSNRGETSP